jgi:putative ABC transport system permease protein
VSLLLGSLTIGIIVSLLALGVYISFRIFKFPDMSCEGSFTLGAAVATVLVVAGSGPLMATLAAVLVGGAAGALTGVIHTRFKVNDLLAGILVMTALYSINLHVMGTSNLPLGSADTFGSVATKIGMSLSGGAETVSLLGRPATVQDLSILAATALIVTVATLLLFAFFNTQMGLAMRATGDNSQMIRALGSSDSAMQTAGLALSNAMCGLSGALLAQYQGFADIGMGIGTLVTGLASVILGEALVGSRKLGHLLVATILGGLLYRLLVAVALRIGLNPNDLKLVTAAFVLVALVSPMLYTQWRKRRDAGAKNA